MTHCRDTTKASYLSPPTISDEPLFDPPLKKKTKMMKKTVACSDDPLVADAEPIVHEQSVQQELEVGQEDFKVLFGRMKKKGKKEILIDLDLVSTR